MSFGLCRTKSIVRNIIDEEFILSLVSLRQRQLQSTLSSATTLGARESGRLREVVTYGNNQKISPKLCRITNSNYYTKLLPH